MLQREWFSAGELAAMALPGMPTTKRGIAAQAAAEGWAGPGDEGTRWRARAGKGGGVEYHFSVLPSWAQIKLVTEFNSVDEVNARAEAKADLTREEMWRWFDRQPDAKKAKAARKLEALDAIRILYDSGMSKTYAMQMIASQWGVQIASLYNWERQTDHIPRADWLPYLAPRHAGRTSDVECPADAWEMLKSDFLRPERPTFTACYRRLQAAAPARGWTLPAPRTLERKLQALPKALRVLARDGAEAMKRMFPAQQRDRTVFHAMQAVNADGHKWDVFVRWQDGSIGRPMMCAFQDLYSGKILSWRIDRSANKELVRLAFGDMVDEFGIPDDCYLDNGRDFASKWIAGGTPTRYRFKVKDEEPDGILTLLGVRIHWTTPYAGQSKPIERAFRDFATDVAKHPAFAGAYVGHNPMAKPENYGHTAVPIDTFLQVIGQEIVAHNARVGRRSAIAAGRSLDQTFAESYEKSPVRKVTADQRRLWLLAAEGVVVDRTNGSITLQGNRFWADFMADLRGQRVVVRFDPQALQDDVHIYRLNGAYLGSAPCTLAAGFNDIEAARRHNQQRKAWMRGNREMLAAERSLSVSDVAAMLPNVEPPEPPAARVVRMVAGNTALKPERDQEQQLDEERRFASVMRELRLVRGPQMTDGEFPGD